MKAIQKIPARSAVMAVVLLAAVLAMAYGYFVDNSAVLYAGIAVTAMTALNMFVFSVIGPNILRPPLRRR